eukprot:4368730-Amphidinium_carterae.2
MPIEPDWYEEAKRAGFGCASTNRALLVLRYGAPGVPLLRTAGSLSWLAICDGSYDSESGAP